MNKLIIVVCFFTFVFTTPCSSNEDGAEQEPEPPSGFIKY